MEKVATMASGATRAPQQKRSRASYERMLNAAEKLLISRGSDDFTLTDVSKAGKVSIGSIYCRFDSKDELIHTVHNQVMDRLLAEEALLIEAIRNNARNLATLIPELFGAYADLLDRHAPILRPLMMRAASDPLVSTTGKQASHQASARIISCLLDYTHEITHPDPVRAAASVYRTVYAVIGRYLGFGSPDESAREGDWDEVKADLADMCAAYLMRAR